MRTAEEKKAWDLQCFGLPQEQMVAMKPEFTSNIMYAMMILSDAQEMIARGEAETGRQFINQAKYFMTQEMHSQEKREN